VVNESSSVAARLSAEIASHRLTFDAAQREAAARLDALRGELRARPPSFIQKLRARLTWLPEIAQAPVRGLYLWGGVGRGKTLLMDLFFASLQDSAGGPAIRGERCHFYHFMRDVHAELSSIKQQAEPLETVAQHWADRTQVICLDEFFVTDIGDAMILSSLFEGLFRRGVTLVTTSNVRPQDLYKEGLQRQRFLPAIELIRKNVDVLHLDGGLDYRLRQLEQAPTYLDSRRADSAAALQQRFAMLAAGMDTGPTSLSLLGRTLRAVNSGPGIAWFEFSELCDGPRSQLDYIELARLYQTLVIANVPTFDPFTENAARRFIMLIDELYDRGVKIIVTAAAPPTELYRGERLQMEFERAASRLIEMQTQDYLSGQHRP
jgi:cell division protein ZapE